MRRWVAMLLLPVVASQGCASGGLPRTVVGGPGGAADFAAVNRALEDRLATVELKSGEVAQEVESVKMTPESTSWTADEKARTVPTAQVQKVTRLLRRRAWRGIGYGLAVGAVAGGIAATHEASVFFLSDRGLAIFAATTLGCGLVGLFVTEGLRQPPDRVVYVAPVASAAELRRADPLLAAGSGGRRCRLAAPDAPVSSPAIVCDPG